MPRRRSPWQVTRDPASVRYAFFLSHVAEDARDVEQLQSEIHAISGRGGRPALDCFLDRNRWPTGNVSSVVIREYLLKSWHMVVWVTPAYLETVRGWIWMELAYAELVELSLNADRFDLQHPYIVPVFRGVTVEPVARTPLLAVWQRQLTVPEGEHPISDVAQRLVEFFEQEARKRVTPGT